MTSRITRAEDIKSGDDLADFLKGLQAQVESDARTSDKEFTKIMSLIKGGVARRGYDDGFSDGIGEIEAESGQWHGMNTKNLTGILRAVVAKNDVEVKAAGGEPAIMDWMTKAGLGTALQPDSGTGVYTLPVEYSRELMKVAAMQSVMLPLVSVWPTTTRVMKIPKRGSFGSGMQWVGSGGAALSEVSATFSSDDLTAYPLAGWIAINEDVLEDASADLGAYFAQEFVDDLADELDNQILNGTGTPWYGLLQMAGTAGVTLASGGKSYQNITVQDLLNMIQALPYAKYRRNASFTFSPLVMDTIVGLRDAQGDPVIAPYQQGRPDSLLGYPLHIADAAPSPVVANTPFAVFGDLHGFVLGKRKEISVQLFDQTSYRVNYSEIFIRAYSRWGGVIPFPAQFAVLKTAV